ncbi:hypothetical protein DINM_001572 [Dirofilaria immitis]|nr:hypothetical protein [Dirofilaria immitis]
MKLNTFQRSITRDDERGCDVRWLWKSRDFVPEKISLTSRTVEIHNKKMQEEFHSRIRTSVITINCGNCLRINILLLYYILIATLPSCIAQMLAESDSLLQLGITDPFKCNICNKGFLQSNDLIAHNWTHREKSFECSVCNQKILSVQRERPFKCNVCNKGFLRNDHLKEHIRIHLGERPFKCNVCGRNFTQHSEQRSDSTQSTHRERPFECSVCNERFFRNGDLNRHIRIHTGERPFKCNVCVQSVINVSASRCALNTAPLHPTQSPTLVTFGPLDVSSHPINTRQ